MHWRPGHPVGSPPSMDSRETCKHAAGDLLVQRKMSWRLSMNGAHLGLLCWQQPCTLHSGSASTIPVLNSAFYLSSTGSHTQRWNNISTPSHSQTPLFAPFPPEPCDNLGQQLSHTTLGQAFYTCPPHSACISCEDVM